MIATKVYTDILQSESNEIWLRGSTRSSKTWSLAQLTALWLLYGHIGNLSLRTGVLSVVRKTLPALVASFLRDFEDICRELNFHPARTYNEFRYNGRLVEFFSIDDSSKVKSRKRDVLIINELTELDFEDYTELTIRTKHLTIADFNPDYYSWVKDAEKDKTVFHYNYTNNPTLTPNEIANIEKLKSNPYLWQTLGLGHYMAKEGLVLPKWKTFSELPFDVDYGAKWFGGLDFGMNDPTVLVKVGIFARSIWVYECIYQSNLSNSLLADLITERWRELPIFADNDRRAVNDLQNRGLHNLTFAVKGKVIQGIRRLQDLDINIHVDAKNVLRELKSYCYEKGTDIPQDKNNHAIDAIRYVTNTKANVFQVANPIIINTYKNEITYG